MGRNDDLIKAEIEGLAKAIAKIHKRLKTPKKTCEKNWKRCPSETPYDCDPDTCDCNCHLATAEYKLKIRRDMIVYIKRKKRLEEIDAAESN